MRMRIVMSAAFVLCALPVLCQEPSEIEAFMTKFEEAVKGDNYAQMKDLVIKNQPNVESGYFLYETQLCSAISNKNDEDKATRLNVLEKLSTLYSQEFKDRLLVDRLAWVKTLTPEQAVKRLQVTTLIEEGAVAYRRGVKSGEKPDFIEARTKFDKAVPIAKEIGDTYWHVDGNVWLAGVAEKLGEKFETTYYYKRAIELARETKSMAGYIAKYKVSENFKRAIREGGLRDDLIDITIPVEESKKKYAATMEKLAADALNPGGAAGTDTKPGGGAAGGPKGPLPANMPPMPNKHTARIEWVDAEKSKYKEVVGRTVPTPNIRANGPWLNWYPSDVTPNAPAKTTQIPGENLLNNDKGKILFDPDGKDGKAPEERLKIAEGKADVIVFKGRPYQDASLSKVDVHHRVMEQPRKFNVNGIALSFKGGNPADAKVQLRWQGATAVTTKFEGYEVTIFDDSANGDFTTWGEDSMIISKGPVAKVVPLSKFIYLGDLLYEVKLDPNGQNIRFKPYDGPVALLEFKYVATTMPTFMILEGMNENLQFYVNLMECKDKPIWVPPGEYKFKDGYFMFGEGDKRETITVANTKCTSFKVTEGQLNKCEMGGAKAPGFTFLWKSEMEKDKGKTMIRVPGKHIQVFGCAGEEYGFFMTGVVRPFVKMRIGKEGAPFFDKQMKAPAREDIEDTKPWGDTVFFPKDIDAEKASSGDVFIQLEGDYPKLGKVTSTPAQVQ